MEIRTPKDLQIVADCYIQMQHTTFDCFTFNDIIYVDTKATSAC